MQEVKIQDCINESWAESLIGYLHNHFKNYSALSFVGKPVGDKGRVIVYAAGGEAVDNLKDQINYWTGYYYCQITAVRTAPIL